MLIQRKFQINWSDISFGKIKRIGGLLLMLMISQGLFKDKEMTMTMTFVMNITMVLTLTICKILIIVMVKMWMNVLYQCHLCFGKCSLCKVSYWVGGWVVLDEYKEWLGRTIKKLCCFKKNYSTG